MAFKPILVTDLGNFFRLSRLLSSVLYYYTLRRQFHSIKSGAGGNVESKGLRASLFELPKFENPTSVVLFKMIKLVEPPCNSR